MMSFCLAFWAGRLPHEWVSLDVAVEHPCSILGRTCTLPAHAQAEAKAGHSIASVSPRCSFQEHGQPQTQAMHVPTESQPKADS